MSIYTTTFLPKISETIIFSRGGPWPPLRIAYEISSDARPCMFAVGLYIVQQVCGKNGTMQPELLLLKKITFFAELLANWN